MKTRCFFFGLILLLFCSCSQMIHIEKRRYRSGFYINHAGDNRGQKVELCSDNKKPAKKNNKESMRQKVSGVIGLADTVKPPVKTPTLQPEKVETNPLIQKYSEQLAGPRFTKVTVAEDDYRREPGDKSKKKLAGIIVLMCAFLVLIGVVYAAIALELFAAIALAGLGSILFLVLLILGILILWANQ